MSKTLTNVPVVLIDKRIILAKVGIYLVADGLTDDMAMHLHQVVIDWANQRDIPCSCGGEMGICPLEAEDKVSYRTVYAPDLDYLSLDYRQAATILFHYLKRHDDDLTPCEELALDMALGELNSKAVEEGDPDFYKVLRKVRHQNAQTVKE
jgi:hypothetical protein